MMKYFKAFQDLIESLNFKFSAIYLSKTWLQTHEISNSNFQLSGYYSFHLTREKNRGGGLCSFLAETYSYKLRKDFQVNLKVFECLRVEAENKKSENIVLNVVYGPPNGDHEELHNYFESSLETGNLTKRYHFSWRFYHQFARICCKQKSSKFCKSYELYLMNLICMVIILYIFLR